MPLVRKLLFGTAAGLLLVALGYEAKTFVAQRREIARLRALLAAPATSTTMPAAIGTPATDTSGDTAIDPTADPATAAWFAELRRRIAAAQEFLARNPRHRIPEFEALTPDDWISVAAGNDSLTEKRCREAAATLRWKAKSRVFDSIWRKVRDRIEQRSGEIPASREEIERLLTTSLERQTFARFELVGRGNITDLGETQPILRESGTDLIDPALDCVIVQAWRQQTIQPLNSGSTKVTDAEMRLLDAYIFAGADYMRANGGKRPAKVEDVLPYFSDPKEAAAFLEQHKRTGRVPVL